MWYFGGIRVSFNRQPSLYHAPGEAAEGSILTMGAKSTAADADAILMIMLANREGGPATR
jgi:hypothetical protein